MSTVSAADAPTLAAQTIANASHVDRRVMVVILLYEMLGRACGGRRNTVASAVSLADISRHL
jgi:hypothetical protein